MVVPVATWRLHESRLGLPLARANAMRTAFALDTIAAIRACEHVGALVVVSAQPDVVASCRRMAVPVLAGPGLMSGDPLNAAVDAGRRWAVLHRRDAPVVVVPSDLPCLTPSALSSTLGVLATRATAHVPDAVSRSTTLISALNAAVLQPAYGGNSTLTHSVLGSWAALGVPIEVRRDVDTAEHLTQALAIGVGPATAAAWERFGIQPAPRRRPRRVASLERTPVAV
ncbi:hypothetical protein ASD11_14315 [Aeromicrobium sp. Root495]|nr:hypothetical protein ASD11_14315 [Aeromicrobium sp. Root495]